MKNGGQAFPYNGKSGDGTHWVSHPGMTLRDWLAGQALEGQLSSVDQKDIESMGAMPPGQRAAMFAHYAYLMADAMLAERDKQ